MKKVIAAALVALFACVSSNADASQIRPAVGFDISYTRAWVYGVDMNLFDARFAAGFSTNAKEGTYVDVLGTISLVRGATEAGRDAHGMGIIGPMVVLHTGPLRFGGGLELGYLSVERSSYGADQISATGRIIGLLGVEPFKVGAVAAVIDVRGHMGFWGDASMPGVTLALGVRY